MIYAICYHRVLPLRTRSNRMHWRRGTVVSCENFRAQLDLLTRDFVLCDEADVLAWFAAEEGTWPRDRPGAWITFDDGYMDNLTWAAPIARAFGVRPGLFVSTRIFEPGWRLPVDRWYAMLCAARRTRGELSFPGLAPWCFDLDRPEDLDRFIDGPEKRAFLRSPSHQQELMLDHLGVALEVAQDSLEVPDYLTERALRSLAERGWLIGTHTHSHALLTQTTHDQALHELDESQSVLAPLLPEHSMSRCFAYPDGAWDTATRELIEQTAAETGWWRAALTIDPAPITRARDRWTLPRYIARDTPDLSWLNREENT